MKCFNKKGITMVELTVVLIIIGMTSSFLQVSTHWMNRVKLENKAQEIVSAIEYAKQAAILTGTSYRLTFQSKDNSFQIIQQGELKLISKVILDENQILSSESNATIDMTINNHGAINKATTLVLKCKGLDQQIRITIGVATSKVRVYKE